MRSRLWVCSRRYFTTVQPSVKELFQSSKSCAILPYRNDEIYLMGDLSHCDKSLQRIHYTIRNLRPRIVLLETDNPDPKGSYKMPHFSGQVINDSYMAMYSKSYGNLASQFATYHKLEDRSHAILIDDWVKTELPQLSPNYIFTGKDMTSTLTKKSDAGQLEELLINFTEEKLREAKRNRHRRKKPSPQREPMGFFGRMEGVDDDEQNKADDLAMEMIADLTALANRFPDLLMDATEFRNIAANLVTIDDYENLSNDGLVRSAFLNQILRKLRFVNESKMREFWEVMRSLYASQDRSILRLLRKKLLECEGESLVGVEESKVEQTRKEVKMGPILAVVGLPHVFGISSLWKSTDFWKDEQLALEHLEFDEGQRHSDIQQTLKDLKLPFVSSKMPQQ